MRRQATWAGLGTVLAVAALPAGAAVLPEDRADIMYHRYEGGGVTIDGPAQLVRTDLRQQGPASRRPRHRP